MKTRKGRIENFDPQVAASNSYNDEAGAQKNLAVGPKLLPIKTAESTYTTDATTARQVPAGTQLWIYNNANAVASITTGNASSVSSLAAGVTDANGRVGIALPPNTWTQVSMGEDTWLITSAATALVYVLADHTHIK